ncbi:ATP-dependent helicase [Corynebacterium variabile]|uniref:ATP-dependent helicase n=1 Tax=Corynebacterium variabile TaxID=1727 RepID=UPI002FE2D399
MTLRLSDEQRVAVHSEATRLTIIAPPGCGKTEVLAHRVAFLIDSLEPGQQILALTFTNRAKANLMDRLRQTLGVAAARRYVSVQNFHGHATGIILSHGRTLGLTVTQEHLPKISTLSRALAQLESDGKTRGRAAEILAEAKRAPRSDGEVLAWVRERGGDPAASLALQVEEARQASGQLHYEDLLRHAQRILHVDGVSRLYQRHYGAVVVDEFQDMSPQQLDLAERSCATSRTFAGDPGQGIFSWAGASPAEVERRLVEQCGAPTELRGSYRSSPQVLEMVTRVAAKAGRPALVSARPDAWPEGGCSARLLFQDRESEADAVVQLVSAVTSNPAASIGIILRSAWRGEEIGKALDAASVSVRRWDLAIDDPQTMDLIRRTAARLPRGAGLSDARAACLVEVAPADVDTRELVLDAFEVLDQAGQSTIRGALRVVRVTDPQLPVGPGAHLLSAHKGKGQQFDWVVVPGLDQGHVPDFRAVSPASLVEELRVLLVMLSRARHGVVVTRSLNARGKKPPHRLWSPEASPWWPDLQGRYQQLDDVLRHCQRVSDQPAS